MSIAAAVLDAVREETARHPSARAGRAGLRIGELSGVEPESLRFCLEVLVADSDLAPLAFEIEICHWQRRCRACGNAFRVIDYITACPSCSATETDPAGGDQMELAYIELEEP
jgi:hydrogenase nickel incorporation protein HypA/HybF